MNQPTELTLPSYYHEDKSISNGTKYSGEAQFKNRAMRESTSIRIDDDNDSGPQSGPR